MTKEKHKNLAQSLQNMREARKLSLAEFSKELDIPKSTLQAIMEGGHTTLHTAMQIAQKLGIPLDTLTNGRLTAGQIKVLDGLMLQLGWYDRLPKTKQKEVSEHIYALIRLIQESEEGPEENE